MKHVVTFYRFIELKNVDELAENLQKKISLIGCVGTVLVAEEGINATLAHDTLSQLEYAVEVIRKSAGEAELETKYSTAKESNSVFYRLKIKRRKEIIHFGEPLKKEEPIGQHVGVEEWNRLIDDPNSLVLDVRNNYETEVGSFENALTLDLNHFRDLAQVLPEKLPKESSQPIAMYCTGGVRCEKASKWLIKQGFTNVYQLDGGILNYLAAVEQDESKWQGECFVFDQRVTVDENLNQGNYRQCFACRRALSDDDRDSDQFVEGVSCPNCIEETSQVQKDQFAERMKQIELAKAKGQRHVGLSQKVLSD